MWWPSTGPAPGGTSPSRTASTVTGAVPESPKPCGGSPPPEAFPYGPDRDARRLGLQRVLAAKVQDRVERSGYHFTKVMLMSATHPGAGWWSPLVVTVEVGGVWWSLRHTSVAIVALTDVR